MVTGGVHFSKLLLHGRTDGRVMMTGGAATHKVQEAGSHICIVQSVCMCVCGLWPGLGGECRANGLNYLENALAVIQFIICY